MIKDCSRAKQLTEWVETTDKSKVIEFPSCLSSFLGQTSLHGGKERLWGFLARVGQKLISMETVGEETP